MSCPADDMQRLTDRVEELKGVIVMMMQLSGTVQGDPPKGGSGTALPITDCAWCGKTQVECRRVNHLFYCQSCYKVLHGLWQSKAKPPLPQWEYIEFSFLNFAELQEHGRNGWEIFSIIPGTSGYKHAVGKRELRPESYVPKAVVEREVRESD